MSKPLLAAIRLVADRIEKHSGTRRLHESATRASLIDPILEALAWDVRDVDEVQLEFRPRRRDNPVDYAMFDAGSPKLFVEAKALGSNLDDRRWAAQVLGYATVAGVPWVALTDGREWRIYNAHAPVDVDGKLFRTVDVVADAVKAAETLWLISKESLQTNEIEALWQSHFVDRQVRAAMETVFGAEVDPSMVRLLRRHTRSLSPTEIAASLRRMRLMIQFPLDAAASAPTAARKEARRKGAARKAAGAGSRRARGASSTTLLDLLKAGLLTSGAKLTSRYREQDLEATVLDDGTVRVGAAVYDSPSAAGGAPRAAAQGLRPNAPHPATNGWDFWRVVPATGGSPEPLAQLRAMLAGGEPRADGAPPARRLRVVRGE
jgi:predicted type IV restriction endonuclease